MPSQTIPNATIPDIEAALLEQFGRIHVRQINQTADSGAWVFRSGPRQWAKCRANLAAGGATVTASGYFPWWAWVIVGVLTIIGLIVFIIPGLVIMAGVAIRLVFSALAVRVRFPKLVESIKKIAATRELRTAANAPPVT